MKIAGLDIGGTEVKYCVYDTSMPFSIDIVKRAPTQADKGGMFVVDNAINLLSDAGSFERIGLCSAGQVNPKSGEIIYACDNIPNYTGVRLGKIFSERYNVPVVVENDVNSAILAEALFGSELQGGFVVGLTYGTGIGGAIIQNGRLYYGSSYSAGEFGHTVTHAGGLDCTCGGKGCYEMYASTGALCRMAEIRFNKSLSGRDILARRDIPEYAALIEEWIEEVVYGLFSIVHIFNPSDLILGGGIMEDSFILSSVSARLLDSIMPSYRNMSIWGARLGNAAGLRGALHLALNHAPSSK
jgi:predicted NBD/HSP70 family sugar kinase